MLAVLLSVDLRSDRFKAKHKRAGKTAVRLREEADDATSVTRSKKCVERLQKVLSQFAPGEEDLPGPARDVSVCTAVTDRAAGP